MSGFQAFFEALGIDPNDRGSVARLAEASGVPTKRLEYYDAASKFPTEPDLSAVCAATGRSPLSLKLQMGHVDHATRELLRDNAEKVVELLRDAPSTTTGNHAERGVGSPVFTTNLGNLYQDDCLPVLKTIQANSVDLVFADPPFNLKKIYPSNIDDNRREDEYIRWCEEWLTECIRVLKPGGSLFVWNLPSWNAKLAAFLNSRLTFRHWIAVDIKYSLPIQKRLYPSHYSLVYFVKGDRPATFHPDRMPMEVCPHCTGDLRDYGGYKAKMNPKGVSLTDIWYDIPPVRHARYKGRKDANEVSLKLLDRVIEMASNPGDLVFDPFGGSGTTYMAAEIKGRRWLGCELGPVEDIVKRFDRLEEEKEYLERFRSNLNALFPEPVKRRRAERGQWTCESVREKERRNGDTDDMDGPQQLTL